MKFLIACLALVAAAQAVDWAKVKPVTLVRHTTGPKPPSGKIIGGGFATPGQFPYQAAVILDGAGFCGGSLISDTVILTAAHCAKGAKSFEIHLGAHFVRNETEPNHQVITSTEAIVHERYNQVIILNDIALVILPEPVSGPGLAPVRLPSYSQADDLLVGSPVVASGWGKPSDESETISEELKFVDLTVITNDECAESFGIIITTSKICVGTKDGTEGTCNGDSGGPLVMYEDDGLPTEVGLVSFGSAAGCESGWPAVFTRITSYLEWLEKNAKVTIRP